MTVAVQEKETDMSDFGADRVQINPSDYCIKSLI